MNFVTPAFSSPTPTPTATIIPTPIVTATITITPTPKPCEDATTIKVDKTELIFSKKAIDSWVITTVDSSGGESGEYPSIALDSSDKAHIVYFYSYTTQEYITQEFFAPPLSRDLKYATNASGSWVITTVDSSGGEYTSIALDSSNKVHISYSAWGPLQYATNASGSWVITTVDSGEYPSIALDSSDRAHISYSAGVTSSMQQIPQAHG